MTFALEIINFKYHWKQLFYTIHQVYLYIEDISLKQDPSSRNVVIEQHKRFSQSALWRLQREYFEKEGIGAWVNQVPFYITSNPFIARCYARLAVGFIRDWLKIHPEAKKNPFYILELGTGSGKFSFYALKMIRELLDSLNLQDVAIVYIMSDFTRNNIQYYETHPALKPYLDKGMIDFAIYDMESDRPITLIRQNIRLTPEVLVNPLIVFANYIFDTISHDSFAMHKGKLYELLISLNTTEDNMHKNQPVNMEKINTDYRAHEISSNYYQDDHLNAILEEYKTTLTETSFLFPIGSFHAIKYLKKISDDKLFIISTDKGYSTPEALDHLGHPTVSFHGSFSMMVNFHAISEYFKKSGGDAFLQTPRKGIKTSVFLSNLKLADLPETQLAVKENVEGLSPADYFTLHRRMSDALQECSLETLAAHMHFAGWDPHMYLKLTSRINSLVSEADPDTVNFMAHNMATMAGNYYHMPKSECILFEIAVFFHAIKRYQEALDYYLQALPYVGEQFGLLYNIALCQHNVGQHEEALSYFKKALAHDKESKETEEWITYMEKLIKEKM